jgi:phosphoenolpyruvate mutase
MTQNIKTAYVAISADLIHRGHLNVIKEAAKYGRVIVGVLTDEAVASYKRLPLLPFEHRKEIIENIKGVDDVVTQDTLDYTKNLLELKPDYVVHGDDWQTGPQVGVRKNVIETIAAWNGELIETSYVTDVSSAQINQMLRENGTTPTSRLQMLKRLLATKDIVRVLEVHSGLSSLIAENISVDLEDKTQVFDAMWLSSLTTTASMGKPDIETVDITARLASMNDILDVTTKPIIYDGDSGGHTEHFWFLVKTLERHGISAVIIEDKVSGGGKRNSLFGTGAAQLQEDPVLFSEKIATGKRAQVTKEFMIIARVESLILEKGIDDAMMRAEHYIGAKADGIMIHSSQKTPDEIIEFCKQFRVKWPDVPLVVVPSSYNSVHESTLIEAGVSVVIYANHLLRASYPAMNETAKRILTHGRSKECDDICESIKNFINLIPAP